MQILVQVKGTYLAFNMLMSYSITLDYNCTALPVCRNLIDATFACTSLSLSLYIYKFIHIFIYLSCLLFVAKLYAMNVNNTRNCVSWLYPKRGGLVMMLIQFTSARSKIATVKITCINLNSLLG